MPAHLTVDRGVKSTSQLTERADHLLLLRTDQLSCFAHAAPTTHIAQEADRLGYNEPCSSSNRQTVLPLSSTAVHAPISSSVTGSVN